MLSRIRRAPRLPHASAARAAAGALLLVLLAAPSPRAEDVLTLASGETLTGTFGGFSGSQFLFTVGEAEARKVQTIKIAAMTLAPALEARLKRRGGRNADDLTLTGYTKPNFQFKGPDGAISVPAGQVVSIEVLDTLQRSMRHLADRERREDPAPDNGTFTLPTGRAAVVHFHMESVVSSQRQGQYARTLAAKHDAAYLRLQVRDWTDPVATRYQITSAPQFWFYDKEGRETARLTERFTDSDLEQAFRDAAP